MLKLFLLVDSKSLLPQEPIYWILPHPEGYSAYLAEETGGTIQAIADGDTPEDIAAILSEQDSDDSVDIRVFYDVVEFVSQKL
jgi:hypothetical protein